MLSSIWVTAWCFVTDLSRAIGSMASCSFRLVSSSFGRRFIWLFLKTFHTRTSVLDISVQCPHALLSCETFYTIYILALLARILLSEGGIWKWNPSKALLLLHSRTRTPEIFPLQILTMLYCKQKYLERASPHYGVRIFVSIWVCFPIMHVFWCISKRIPRFPCRFPALWIPICWWQRLWSTVSQLGGSLRRNVRKPGWRPVRYICTSSSSSRRLSRTCWESHICFCATLKKSFSQI